MTGIMVIKTVLTLIQQFHYRKVFLSSLVLFLLTATRRSFAVLSHWIGSRQMRRSRSTARVGIPCPTVPFSSRPSMYNPRGSLQSENSFFHKSERAASAISSALRATPKRTGPSLPGIALHQCLLRTDQSCRIRRRHFDEFVLGHPKRAEHEFDRLRRHLAHHEIPANHSRPWKLAPFPHLLLTACTAHQPLGRCG